MELSGRVALVTGSSRGIGAAIAQQLAADGAAVVIHFGSDKDAAHAAQQKVRAAGGVADIVQADFTSVTGPVDAVQRAISIHGALDILVNNAGVFETGAIETITEAQIERMLSVNVRAVLLATKTFAHVTASRCGRVVNISSVAARFPSPVNSLYAASKAAVEALTRSHALELGARGITVNALAPGTTQTDMFAAGFSDELHASLVRGTALRRVGVPEDIAKVASFLCSDGASWITGQIIGVDGGMLSSAGIIAHLANL